MALLALSLLSMSLILPQVLTCSLETRQTVEIYHGGEPWGITTTVAVRVLVERDCCQHPCVSRIQKPRVVVGLGCTVFVWHVCCSSVGCNVRAWCVYVRVFFFLKNNIYIYLSKKERGEVSKYEHTSVSINRGTWPTATKVHSIDIQAK